MWRFAPLLPGGDERVDLGAGMTPLVRAPRLAAELGLRELWLKNDTANPTRYFECFMDESWLEHLRQHERVSAADRAIQNHAKSFLLPGTTTRSSHWLADRTDRD